ncbi:MAG: response regulator [Anaerolineales bacterium]|nr:response regulator [Anaerolineales bacterium]
MEHNILLVDDQREVLRLLHSSLDTLKDANLKVFESQSGEEALLESSRRKIDLLVTDYKLPGMSGVELMHKIRARHPEAKVILISGLSERKARQEMINAGAFAIFDKPLSVADFLDAVERGLGFVETIFASELKSEEIKEERPLKFSDLLTNFRQDINADVVFLINQSGFIQARTGKLRDDSVEASLISVLVSIHNASLKVAKYSNQKTLSSHHIFSGGDYDLLFIPINPLYALMVAGAGLASEERVLETVGNMLALRVEVEKSLKSIGATGELRAATTNHAAVSAATPVPTIRRPEAALEALPSLEMIELLKGAADKKIDVNADDFWNQAVEKHGSKPVNSEVISLEEARKLGLLPDDGK